MFVLANQKMLYEILETPGSFRGLFCVATDNIQVVGACPDRLPASILTMPEINDNSIRRLLD